MEAGEPAAATGIPEPSSRLPSEARTYFVLQALGAAIPLVAVALIVAGALDGHAPGLVVLALRFLVPLAALLGAPALGVLRWTHWRYELREEEIDLVHGAVVVIRTLIPIVRVQHVETRRSWLSDMAGVQTVVIHTAAGAHEIPGLLPGEAAAIRDRIALLARQPDDL